MVYKQIPKGYFKTEYPLPHNFNLAFSLSLENVAKAATYVPLILNDEALVNADTVNANPEHGSFAESDDAYCYKNSIIPRMMVHITAKMALPAIETDSMRSCVFNWMPVYVSFLNRLDAKDSKTGVAVEAILELEHETVGKSAYPLWSGTDITGGNVGIHATPTTALMGLTGNANIENVVFDKNLFFDAMQYYTNAPMLKKVVGRMKRIFLNRDNMYTYHSDKFTNPIVKRINEYTFCGVLFSVPQSGSIDQVNSAGDTTAINHINFGVNVKYDEWNSEFDQTSS